MNKKIGMLLSFSLCLALGSFAQTVNDNIEKKAKDPTTTENAAKADAYILRHKISDDSLSASSNIRPVTTHDKKKFRKSCCKKGKS